MSLSTVPESPAPRRVPVVPPAIPRRRQPLLVAIGKLGLALSGWRIEGNFPDVPRMIIVVAPHTSNWDLLVGLLADFALDIDARWFGKHTIFRWPLAGLLRAMGGIAIRRDERNGVVAQSIEEFARRDQLVLAIAPEGTRKKVAEWRTGFWYIAKGAGVPIVLASLDFGRRVIGLGPVFLPTEDLTTDLREIKAYYAGVRGKNPERL